MKDRQPASVGHGLDKSGGIGLVTVEVTPVAVGIAGTELADAAALVSLARARCSDAAMQVAHEAVQMHGGIGMTDEHDIGLYLKRARVAELTFGDAAWHRDRWARLGGY